MEVGRGAVSVADDRRPLYVCGLSENDKYGAGALDSGEGVVTTLLDAGKIDDLLVVQRGLGLEGEIARGANHVVAVARCVAPSAHYSTFRGRGDIAGDAQGRVRLAFGL